MKMKTIKHHTRIHVHLKMASHCPIIGWFDGSVGWLEYRMENQAVGAHNRTIVCDFEELDGIRWTLTCNT